MGRPLRTRKAHQATKLMGTWRHAIGPDAASDAPPREGAEHCDPPARAAVALSPRTAAPSRATARLSIRALKSMRGGAYVFEQLLKEAGAAALPQRRLRKPLAIPARRAGDQWEWGVRASRKRVNVSLRSGGALLRLEADCWRRSAQRLGPRQCELSRRMYWRGASPREWRPRPCLYDVGTP
ncbi:hypothetical protein ACSSS7_006894 [Eimeria intestinalis]